MSSVAIVGQGYVGLPLAVAAARAGHHVVGYDLDERRVERLNAGESHIGDVDSAELASEVAAGRYRATADAATLSAVDVIVICVPTPYHDDAPDLSYIESAARDVGPHLKPGTLVILESTTYPGTTNDLLRPILEQASGLSADGDFHLVFSPERIDPGNETYGLRNTPKIVGGLTPEATEAAVTFYGAFVDRVVRVSTPAAAEMAKLLENTFRHINIALVNELAVLADGLDVNIWEVIDAAASKPFGFMPFYPGPGVGGHCIPVDPLYLSWRVRQFGAAARFIELARDVNASMPAYCVSRVQDLLNDIGRPLRGSQVLVLGIAYKPNVADLRESPALPLIELLLAKGADVRFHDPHVQSCVLGDQVVAGVPLDGELEEADIVVVLTQHDAIDYADVARRARLVFDTRNVVPGDLPSVHRL